MTIAALFLALAAPFPDQQLSFDPAVDANLPIEEKWRRYAPDWIVQRPKQAVETVILRGTEPVEIFQIKPKEAFRHEAAAFEKGSKKALVPAGTILVRVPGPLNAACEMLRQPGFERRTCLIDNDQDGKFDNFFRRLDTSMLVMIPAQSPHLYRKLTIKELEGSPAYRVLDEESDMPPVRFVLRSSRTVKKDPTKTESYFKICLAKYETDLPQGEEHFGRDCLNVGRWTLDDGFPVRLGVFGNQVRIDLTTDKLFKVTVIRPDRSFPIKLMYELDQ